MTTISQRELRNDSGRVLREVEQGAELTIARRGTPVARLVPIQQVTGFRPARAEPDFSVEDLVASDVSSQSLIDELRDER